MKLTKKQALDLIKVLTHYDSFDNQRVHVDLYDILEDLEKFVLNGESDEKTDRKSTRLNSSHRT